MLKSNRDELWALSGKSKLLMETMHDQPSTFSKESDKGLRNLISSRKNSRVVPSESHKNKFDTVLNSYFSTLSIKPQDAPKDNRIKKMMEDIQSNLQRKASPRRSPQRASRSPLLKFKEEFDRLDFFARSSKKQDSPVKITLKPNNNPEPYLSKTSLLKDLPSPQSTSFHNDFLFPRTARATPSLSQPKSISKDEIQPLLSKLESFSNEDWCSLSSHNKDMLKNLSTLIQSKLRESRRTPKSALGLYQSS